MERYSKKRGQVWVETVIYTLIAFSLMALVLGVARPRIMEQQDRAAIEQSIDSMQQIDLVFDEVKEASGNKRVVKFTIKKGFLRIDGNDNKLTLEFEGSHTYSEPGVELEEGRLMIKTEEVGKISFVNISRDYSDYNLTYQDEDVSKILSESPTPYNLVISNEGKDSSDKTIINFDIS